MAAELGFGPAKCGRLGFWRGSGRLVMRVSFQSLVKIKPSAAASNSFCLKTGLSESQLRNFRTVVLVRLLFPCHIATIDIGQNGEKSRPKKVKTGMKRSPSSAFTPHLDAPRDQYGAVCWRKTGTGLDILLITSRETGRWVIPKGWPVKGLTAATAAAREAWEEAGVEGKLGETCLGVFTYEKIMPENQSIPCAVAIYGLRVEKLSRRYPEQKQRRRKWFSAQKAAALVSEPELSALLLALDQEAQIAGAEAARKLKRPEPALPQIDS